MIKILYSIKRFLTPVRVIAFGFLTVILVGSGLLMLPFCIKEGVDLKYIDALYTSTSAVCVTGLIAVDAGDTFTTAGQIILAVLIQVGGLGVTTVGTGIMIAIGKKIDLRGRNIIMEASNTSSVKGTIKLLKRIFIYTAIVEGIGAFLSFSVFVQKYSIGKAIGISLFHSVAAFNNSGFDILGGGQSLIPYQNDVVLNFVTSGLIIIGGLGFLVIKELLEKKFRWRNLSMHAKVVITVNTALTVIGTVLLRFTEEITWLGAFFSSVSARTAGFATFPMGNFTSAGLMIMIVLMFIGASPGSTGGGIKTTTFFVLINGIRASATNRRPQAFNYSVPRGAYKKSSMIALLGITVVILGTLILSVFEPGIPLEELLFETVSAFGTVGLSTGITGGLKVGSKIVSIIVMFIGRLGPMTIVTLWSAQREERIKYPDGNISIG